MTAVSDRAERRHGRGVRHAAIVQAGHNCWRVDRADRFRCIQDAAQCFRWTRDALLGARQSIFIVGWDIQANLDLLPDADPPVSSPPTRLDALLAFIVRRRPELRCYLLIWDHAALYTLERDPLSRWRLGWRMPRQVRFGFDDHHPVGGSHHQKIVVVDDAVAFCGGVDLTGHRWDTTAHRIEEPARTTAIGTSYGPYHEVQAMLSGPAAASLGTLVRERWRVLGEEPRPLRAGAADRLWPEDAEPDFSDVDVAIARTVPASERGPGVRECERLYLDSIAAAERAIYIESQYFTNDRLAAALASRLREPDGPEAIVVLPRRCEGWLERQTMGALRDRVLRDLTAADRYDRLRLVYPAASRAADVTTFVHSKVMIVDDRLLRIGSANFSRRSMGVDTECDVAVDATADPQARLGVRRVRDRMLGEHLAVPGDRVASAMARLGSLRAVVDAMADRDRTLVRVDVPSDPSPPADVVRTAADPDEPIEFGARMAAWIPPLDARADRGTVRLWLPAVVVAALVAWLTPGVWRRGLAELQGLLDAGAGPAGPWVALGALLLAHMALIPLELLAIVAGLTLGLPRGAVVAVLVAWLGAAVGYVAGRVITPANLAPWMSRRSYRSIRQLGAHGVGGVAILRLVSVASAGAAHLVCGAAKVPVAAYAAGSLIGLTPIVIALSALGALVRAATLQPSWARWAAVGVMVLVLVGLAVAVRTLLLLRQFSPTVSRQHLRAEFG
jgi:phospholipase D1/2